MICIKIDVKKIDKELLYHGQKGIYLNAALVESPSEYGDDGFIRQDVGKEARAAGQKGNIIGSYRDVGITPKPKPTAPTSPKLEDQDEIPF